VIALDYSLPTDKEGLQLRLGVAKGFFRDEGIDLNIRVIFGGPEIAANYDSGAVKMGELGTPPAITAIGKGARFKIVASGVRRSSVMYLVAAPSIKTWNDLRGKTAAALTIGSCSYWYMRLVLQSHDLNPDSDVNVIGLGERYPRLLELFESGELQAAIITEPNVSIGESRGLFRVMQPLTDPEYCPTMQWIVVVANDRFIEQEPELIRTVLRASRRSYRYCADHPDEWFDFGARHFGIDRETMKRSIERERAGLHFDCQPDMPGLQLAIGLQERLGALKRPLLAADISDLRFLPGREVADVA
jgi:NitT/TauT family transport system substrate-binding protein